MPQIWFLIKLSLLTSMISILNDLTWSDLLCSPYTLQVYSSWCNAAASTGMRGPVVQLAMQFELHAIYA